MFRTIVAILLILIGIVGIAAGVWGIYTVQTNDALSTGLALIGLTDLAPQTEEGEKNILLDGTNAVLDAATSAVDKIDEFAANTFGTSATDYVNSLVNEKLGIDIDLTNEMDVKLNICRYRVEILLIGIIVVQIGLLMIKYRR